MSASIAGVTRSVEQIFSDMTRQAEGLAVQLTAGPRMVAAAMDRYRTMHLLITRRN